MTKSDDAERKGSSLRGSFNLERQSAGGASHFAKSDYYGSGAVASVTNKRENSLSGSNNASATKPPRVPATDTRHLSPKKPLLESTGGNYGLGEHCRRTSVENISSELRNLKKETLGRDVGSNVKLGPKVSTVTTSHSSLVKGAAGITSFSKMGCVPSTNHVLGKTRQFARSTLEAESSPQVLIHKPRNSPKKGVSGSLIDNYGFSVRQPQVLSLQDSQAGNKNLLRYIDKLQRENATLKDSSLGHLETFKLKTENSYLKDAIMMLTGRDAYEFIRPTASSPPPMRDLLSSEDLDTDLGFLARTERGSATLPSQRAQEQ